MGQQWFNNPYDTYRVARTLGMTPVEAAKEGAQAFGQSPAIARATPVLKTGGRIAGAVAPVAMGALDYFDGKAAGEGEGRALTSAVGSGVGGWGGAAAGAALGTAVLPGVGTVLGGIGGALLGSKVGNEAVDTGWKVFTDDDGLQPGSNARKKHFAGLYQEAKAAYNADPTPEKQRNMERFYAEATGTSVPLSSADAVDTVNGYKNFLGVVNNETDLFKAIDDGQKRVTGFGARDYLDPNSKYNSDIRNLEHKYALVNEQMARRAGIFDTTQQIAKEGAKKYLNSVSDGADIAAKFYGRGY